MAESLVLKDVALATMIPNGDGNPFGIVPGAVLAVEDGIIAYAGPAAGYHGDLSAARAMPGRLVLPGFVACHNQICWASEAAVAAADGADYRDIVSAAARATSAASDDELLGLMRSRLERLTRSGATAVELKSGFGAAPLDELRLTHLCRRLQVEYDGLARVTLYAGHFIPDGCDPDDHLAEIEQTLLPLACEQNACDAVEVFCDDEGALDLDQASSILETFYRRRIPTRVSCDHFADSAGATLPASFYSRSATFLNHADDIGLASIASAGTTIILVPEAAGDRPHIAAMRAANAKIALAPHCGPNDPGKLDVLETARIAIHNWDLTPEEALFGITVHAAAALGVPDQSGVLEEGRRGDFAMFEADRPEDILTPGVRPTAVACAGQMMKASSPDSLP